MISLIQSIITIILISLIWIWIIRKIFAKQSKQKIINTSIWSIVSVIIISCMHYISSTYQIEQYYTIIYITITIISILLFIQKKRAISWWIQAILRVLLSFNWWIQGQYSINALWEESFKRIYIKKFVIWLMWEIILFWIISWIVFGRSENIIYFIQWITHKTIVNNITIIEQRSFIPIIIHIWSICLSILIWFKLQNKLWWIMAWLLGIIGGIWIHYFFNIFQINNITIWTIIIIVSYIWIINYSLFRSDLLYIKSKG